MADVPPEFLRTYALLGKFNTSGYGGYLGAMIITGGVVAYVERYFDLHGVLPTGVHNVEAKYKEHVIPFVAEFPSEAIARRVTNGETLTKEKVWQESRKAIRRRERDLNRRRLAAGDFDDPDDLSENIRKRGDEVSWQDWDSGGPGAGAGRVSVYRYEGSFYVFHDAGMEGPYPTKDEAVKKNGVAIISAATVAIWDEDAGYIFQR